MTQKSPHTDQDRLDARLLLEEVLRMFDAGVYTLGQVRQAMRWLEGNTITQPNEDIQALRSKTLGEMRKVRMEEFWAYLGLAGKVVCTVPTHHGVLISDEQIREKRDQGLELYHVPSFEVFPCLDQLLCDGAWGKKLVSGRYKPLESYWFWADISPIPDQSRFSPFMENRLNRVMTLLEYMIASQQCVFQTQGGLWDSESTKCVVQTSVGYFKPIRYLSRRRLVDCGDVPSSTDPPCGWREVIRLIP